MWPVEAYRPPEGWYVVEEERRAMTREAIRRGMSRLGEVFVSYRIAFNDQFTPAVRKLQRQLAELSKRSGGA